MNTLAIEGQVVCVDCCKTVVSLSDWTHAVECKGTHLWPTDHLRAILRLPKTLDLMGVLWRKWIARIKTSTRRQNMHNKCNANVKSLRDPCSSYVSYIFEYAAILSFVSSLHKYLKSRDSSVDTEMDYGMYGLVSSLNSGRFSFHCIVLH
jgi:hypothetical protein